MSADANGWQPMRAAPKDWSDVLLYVPHLQSDWRQVCEGYFDADKAEWLSPAFPGDVLKPKAWQPLPAPPVTA